jgi:hypothetical protein
MHHAMLSRANRRFSEFLLTHETIEELSTANIVEPDLVAFTEDTLPRLRSFTGSASTIGGMATTGMKSLSKYLRHLVIRPSGFAVDLMWGLIRSADDDSNDHQPPSGLSTLQDIQLYNIGWRTADETTMLISESARCCGRSLETWRGTLAVDGSLETIEVFISAVELGNLFAAFTRLRTIYLEIRDIDDDDEGPLPFQDFETVFSSHVRELARRCATLQTIYVKHLYCGLEEIWTIDRTGGGGEVCENTEKPDCACRSIHTRRKSQYLV